MCITDRLTKLGNYRHRFVRVYTKKKVSFYWRFACHVILLYFFLTKQPKFHCFHKTFDWYINWLSNKLDLKWGPMFYWALSGSKLLAKVINGVQNLMLADKEFENILLDQNRMLNLKCTNELQQKYQNMHNTQYILIQVLFYWQQSENST